MMQVVESNLLVEVQLLNDRWHGVGDWPPSPFRLFQALVAGAYGGRWRAEDAPSEVAAAFEWLETLPPPVIGTPRKRSGASMKYYVPNNDLDSKGNDPRRAGEIRVEKIVRPILLENAEPFLFAWQLANGAQLPAMFRLICDRLHTFGWGIDPAFARASVLTSEEFEDVKMRYGGTFAMPSGEYGEGGTNLPCPIPGSLASLHERFAATAKRLSISPSGRGHEIAFRQPPKSNSRLVAYDRPLRRLFLEIRDIADSAKFYPIRLENAVVIAKAARDLAFDNLALAYPADPSIERIVTGRGASGEDALRRIRFVPLPSIGHAHTDTSIRRVMVEMQTDCPVSEADLRWAMLGRRIPSLGRVDLATGETSGAQFVEADDWTMFRRYNAFRSGAVCWQTITPTILPTSRLKGRLSGGQRVGMERRFTADVSAALRHAGINTRLKSVRVQVEPFTARGLRAAAFERDRFEIGRLFHVELNFAEPVRGPIVVGDGRWLGLGLMRPIWAKGVELDQVDEVSSVTDIESGDDDVDDSGSEL